MLHKKKKKILANCIIFARATTRLARFMKFITPVRHYHAPKVRFVGDKQRRNITQRRTATQRFHASEV